MARSKNRNPRPAYPTGSTPASRSEAPAMSPMEVAATVAASMSGDLPMVPRTDKSAAAPAVPMTAPSAAAASVAPPAKTAAPSSAKTSAVRADERAQKDEMRVASGNLPASTETGLASAAPSAGDGAQDGAAPGRSRPSPPAAKIMPPTMSLARVVRARRMTMAAKGKGPVKAAKVVMAPTPGTAAPRAVRRLAVIAPHPGGQAFATLEFRAARAASLAASGKGSSSGAGPAEPRRPSLAASAKHGFWAVGDDVVRPTPLYRELVAKGVASVSNPTSLDIRQMATQTSEDKDGLVPPPTSPTSKVMAAVEPTNVLLNKIRENRKRITRSPSASGDKDGPLAASGPPVVQGQGVEKTSTVPLPLSRGGAKMGAKILEKDINSVLETILTHVDDVESRLDELCESSMLVDEKMDAAINLTQQTLMHVAAMGEKLSKELKDGFYKVRFVMSGSTNAAVDEAPEKTIDMIRKLLREDLDEDFLYTNVTSEVYPDTNLYWDKAVRATSSAIKSGADGAEVFLRSMVHLPSRKDASVYVRMRASIPVLRVKSHMHKWYGELIWAAFVAALMPINQVITLEVAKQLRKNHRYVLAALGRKACISAAIKLCTAIGAFGRIKEPTVAGDPEVIELTLGHFAFVTMKVRNMIERLAGERTVAPVGGDGHYSMWVEEVRFLHGELPKDAEAHDGLRLVDGSSSSRSLPWIGESSE